MDTQGQIWITLMSEHGTHCGYRYWLNWKSHSVLWNLPPELFTVLSEKITKNWTICKEIEKFRVFRSYEMGLSWTGILSQVQWWYYFIDQVTPWSRFRWALSMLNNQKMDCLDVHSATTVTKTLKTSVTTSMSAKLFKLQLPQTQQLLHPV